MANILCIFAHPDDEAFGPSGTIAKWAKDNNVYLICATDGDAAFGKGDGSLAKIRHQELLDSTSILGVKEVFFFDFADGDLSNNLYHKLADKIREKVQELKPEIIMTFENRGVSGHLDHIAVSMITTFVFNKEKYVKELWYNVANKKATDFIKDYFVYFPEGYSEDEVDKVIDVTDVWDKKVAAIKAHPSQSKDGDMILAMSKVLPKNELFLVKKRN